MLHLQVADKRSSVHCKKNPSQNRKLSGNQLAGKFFFLPILQRICFFSNFKTYTLLYNYNLEKVVCRFQILSITIDLDSKGSSLLIVNFEIVARILCRFKKVQGYSNFFKSYPSQLFYSTKIKSQSIKIFHFPLSINSILHFYLYVSAYVFSASPNNVLCWIRTTALTITVQALYPLAYSCIR